jgi:alcohol dehydrogenase class IV
MSSNFINYRGSLSELKSIFENSNAKKILFVTGKKSFSESQICKDLLLDFKDFEILRHSDFEINPKIEDIKRGLEIVEKFNPDIIVGIGGGSVLDTAKLLSSFHESRINLESIIIDGGIKPDRSKGLILIPTTAGSGSEATHFAVIYIGKSKYSYASDDLIADYVILDSRLTDSADNYLTAVTLFDAFSQAIESYWATGSNEVSREYSAKSIKLILENFDNLISKPDSEVRDNMLLASYYAGKAINISKTTAPHAISYAITMNYGVPHGHAVALTLPLYFEYNSIINIDKLNHKIDVSEYLQRYRILLCLLNVDSSKEAASKIINMMLKCGLKTKLSEIGISSESEILELAESVNVERLGNNPMIISRDYLVELLSTLV